MAIDPAKAKAFMTGPRGGRYYITAAGEKRYGEPPVGALAEKMAKARYTPSAEVAAGLPRTHTPTEHVAIAERFLARHKEELASGLDELRAIAPPGAQVSGRVKDVASAVEKVARKPKYGTVDKIQDGTGMRVITNNLDEVRSTVDAIRRTNRVITEDDYITNPKEGYRSHHLIIETPSGLQKEIQVRTKNEHTYAEWAHEVYKPHTEAQKAVLADPHARREIDHYSNAMSSHFYNADRGQPSVKPTCPPAVRASFGCM